MQEEDSEMDMEGESVCGWVGIRAHNLVGCQEEDSEMDEMEEGGAEEDASSFKASFSKVLPTLGRDLNLAPQGHAFK